MAESAAELHFKKLLESYQAYYFANEELSRQKKQLEEEMHNKTKDVNDDIRIQSIMNRINQLSDGDNFRNLCIAIVDSDYVKSRYVVNGNKYYNGPRFARRQLYQKTPMRVGTSINNMFNGVNKQATYNE